MSVASRPVVDLCAGTVCDGGVSVPVRTLDRCAAVVFVGGMSVAVRPFDRSAGTACAGGVSVAVGAADPNTGTFSVDETLLHGSIVRRRGLEGISGPRFLTLGRHRAIQSEPRSPSSHPEAAAQSDELGCL